MHRNFLNTDLLPFFFLITVAHPDPHALKYPNHHNLALSICIFLHILFYKLSLFTYTYIICAYIYTYYACTYATLHI